MENPPDSLKAVEPQEERTIGSLIRFEPSRFIVFSLELAGVTAAVLGATQALLPREWSV